MEIEDRLAEEDAKVLRSFRSLHAAVDELFRAELDRSLPVSEALTNRWDRARGLGFGDGTSIYDSSFIFGTPTVGCHCWIGPWTILDGSGGLAIGDYCTISAGVHIYSHDNVMNTLTSHRMPIERSPVTLGNNVYIGPHALIARGVTIGDMCVVGAGSFINKDIPDRSVVVGRPARRIGRVVEQNSGVSIEYDN